MTTQKILLVCILTASVLLSACQGESKSPESSLPSTQAEVPSLETLVVEQTSIPAGVEQMYPSEGSEVTTTYPAWEVPTVESQALRPPTEANPLLPGNLRYQVYCLRLIFRSRYQILILF